MAGIAVLGPLRGSVGGWRWHALFGVLRQRRRDVFQHASASLRLGGRFSFSRFTQGQRSPSKHVTEGIPLRGRFPPWAVHPPGSVGGRFPVLRTAGSPSGAAGEATRGGNGVTSKHVTKGIPIMARRPQVWVLDVRAACRRGLGHTPRRRWVSGLLLTKQEPPGRKRSVKDMVPVLVGSGRMRNSEPEHPAGRDQAAAGCQFPDGDS